MAFLQRFAARSLYVWCLQTIMVLIVFMFPRDCHAAVVEKSEILKPSNYDVNGASVISHFGEVSVNTLDQWQVNIASEATWQFIVILDDTWAFSSTRPSAIQFTIDSPSISAGPDTFDDLVFGFTANNRDYVTSWIPMDNAGQKNRIYPNCDDQTPPTQLYGVGEVASLPNLDRVCDIAGGSCINWKTMWPKNAQFPLVFERNGFPLTWTLENDPVRNTMSLYLETASFTVGFAQRCGFVAMPSDSGLKIYIGGNDAGHSFIISSFQVRSYFFTSVPTESPTTRQPTPPVPTRSPTRPPTGLPTTTPTAVTGPPTKAPTTAPSPTPSAVPTAAPTASPTVSPSAIPSQSPVVPPTRAPSAPPTAIPSQSPAVPPTLAPSAPPTATPTNAPTMTPTGAPSASPVAAPSGAPIVAPTNAPTQSPSSAPSTSPTPRPSSTPSATPSVGPTRSPTTLLPTRAPLTQAPTLQPTASPSASPTESCPGSKSCEQRLTSQCCQLSSACQWNTREHPLCNMLAPNTPNTHTAITCCSTTLSPTPAPTIALSDRSLHPTTEVPTPLPSSPSSTYALQTVSPKLTTLPQNGSQVHNDDGGGGGDEATVDDAPAGAATNMFGDLVLPVVIVAVIGACALCCVAIVIGRQICYNRKKKQKLNLTMRESPTSLDREHEYAAAEERQRMKDDVGGDEQQVTPQAKMQSLATMKRGHFSTNTLSTSVDLSTVDAFMPAGNGGGGGGANRSLRYGGNGGRMHVKGVASGDDERARIDMIDGQSLTVPLKQAQREQQSSRFTSRLNHIAAAGHGTVDQVGDERIFVRKPGHGHHHHHHHVALKDSDTDEEEEEEEEEEDEDDDDDDETSAHKEMKTELHTYVNHPLQSLAPMSMMSEDDQKLARPPTHSGIVSIGPTPSSLSVSQSKTGKHSFGDLNRSQFGKLQRAINNAKTNSDFEKLEKIIKSGKIPSENWHGKGTTYNHGNPGNHDNRGVSFHGMVTKAFDPSSRLTSAASNVTAETKLSDSDLYKGGDHTAEDSMTYQYHSSDFKLPNMVGTDSQISVKTTMTENSIGVKMPQYRAAKPVVMLMDQPTKPKPNPKSHRSKFMRAPQSRKDRKSNQNQLDQNELMNKLKVVQKQGSRNSMHSVRARETKYNRGTKKAVVPDADENYISEMEDDFDH